MLLFKIVTKTIHKSVALFVLLYNVIFCSEWLCFRASQALKDQFSNS